MNKELFLKMFKNQNHIEQLKDIPQKFNVKHNEDNKTTEITIYGIIGKSWFSDSFSAGDIDKALKEAGNNDVIINLNSPGGNAFDGISIFNRLKRHEGKIIIHIDGYACSAASVIAMAGDEIHMEYGAMMMIHEASSITWGSKQDMRKEAQVLEELEEGIIDIYMTKSNLSREEVRTKVDEETWMSASKAVEYGFATNSKSEEADDSKIENRSDVLKDLFRILENEEIEEPKQNILERFKRQ